MRKFILVVIVIVAIAALLGRFFTEEPKSPTASLHEETAISKESAVPEDTIFKELRSLLPAVTSSENDDAHSYFQSLVFSDENIRSLADNYGYTAQNIVKENGPAGAAVLLAFGKQGVAVMREHPDTFKKIAERFNGPTAAAFLIAYGNDIRFLVKQGGLFDLLDRIERLEEKSKQLAVQHPGMFPFLLMAERETREAFTRNPDSCLACFPAVDLSKGPDSIREVAKMLAEMKLGTSRWIEVRGLDGLLLAKTFPSLLEREELRQSPLPLPIFLQILSTNQNDLEDMLARKATSPEDIWRALKALKDADDMLPRRSEDWQIWEEDDPRFMKAYREDFLNLAARDPHTIRFVLEKGSEYLKLIEKHWPSGACYLPSLLYDAYGGATPEYQPLYDHTWEAIVRSQKNENEPVVLYTLIRMADSDMFIPDDPEASGWFRHLLWSLDHRVVLYVADRGDEHGLSKLRERGIDELNAWTEPTSMAVEMIPGYDASRLIWVLSKGYVPTTGEVAFAAIDGGFLIWDAVTLGSGTVLSVAGRKAAKAGGKKGVQILVEDAGPARVFR